MTADYKVDEIGDLAWEELTRLEREGELCWWNNLETNEQSFSLIHFFCITNAKISSFRAFWGKTELRNLFCC